MRLLLITILIVYSFKGFSQFDGSSTSIISLSGLAYQNIEQDVFSSMNIISSISTIKKKQVGIYSENRFMIKGLAKVQGVLTIPSKKSGFGMQVEYQGINNMNFAGIAAGYGMQISKMTSAGLKIETGRSTFPSGNTIYMIGYQAGIKVNASEKTQLGFHITRRSFPSVTKAIKQNGVYIIHAGIGHTVNEILYLSCEMIKAKNFKPTISPFLKWQMTEKIHAHFGMLEPLNIGYIGLGWKAHKKNIILSFASHPHLGLSGSISLSHDFN